VKNEFKIAVAQLTSTENTQDNIKTIEGLVTSIQDSIEYVFFPENSIYLKIEETDKQISFDLSESIFDGLKELSIKKNIKIYLGSVPFKKTDGVYNSSILIHEGTAESIYDKIHLFDVEVEGEKPSRESDNYRAGKTPVVWNADGWKLGLSICYDLRFSDLFLNYAKKEVDVLLVPAAFLPTTGMAHWHTLLRARAIESQCYVIAPAQSGKHINQNGKIRTTYGHSLIVDPWGEILVDLNNDSPKVEMVKLSKEKIIKVRSQIPMKLHRKEL
jgi:predicted amidohydrolase